MGATLTVRRSTRIALALALALIASLIPLSRGESSSTVSSTIDPALERATGVVGVIVQKNDVRDRSAERMVARLGGTVTRELPIVDGFAATLPASAVDDVARLLSVRNISLNGSIRLNASTSSSALKSVYPKAVRASQMWDSGFTGRGITVALIDTGIANVSDLSGRILSVEGSPGTVPGQTTPCINLSTEAGCDDSYGHGTFMAGIIAGNGAASGGAWKGIAPEANLVSVKIAGRNGAADVSTLLAAIQWVVSFSEQYNIRVLNLSLGTDSTQSYRVDPLNYAVERAWQAGIAVVVSASNRGPVPGTISKPGDDPFVITVGAVDDRRTAGVGDDTLPNFSSRGPTAADGLLKPDVVAPGAHITSLRAPGSEIDIRFPRYIDGSYRKGSGTSMSTAVVSGAVALLLERDPSLSPERIKYMLMATARPAASTDPLAVGAGEIDIAAATIAPAGLANVGLVAGSGTGSLDLSRGTVELQADNAEATLLTGLLTAQLIMYDPLSFIGIEWDGMSWYGMSWYTLGWYGMSWYGSTWSGTSWSGMSWYGQPNGMSWYGMSWYGGAWYGAWE